MSKAGDNTRCNRVTDHQHDNRNCRRRSLGGNDPQSGRYDHIDVGTNQLGREFVEPINVTLRKPGLDDEVLALDVAEVTETNAKCLDVAGSLRSIIDIEISDPSDTRRLLRPGSEWPCGHAAKKRDELSPLHCCPWS